MKNIMAIMLVTAATNSTIVAQKNTKEINRNMNINASVEEVWQVVGHEFANAYIWASSLKHSEALNTESLNGSTCTERACNVSGFGKISEKVLEYSNDEHLLTYEVINGLPKFISTAQNTWRLTTTAGGKTQIKMRLKMQTKGIMGWLLGGIMKMKLKKTVDETLEELKYYVEKGKIHPRTLKAS